MDPYRSVTLRVYKFHLFKYETDAGFLNVRPTHRRGTALMVLLTVLVWRLQPSNKPANLNPVITVEQVTAQLAGLCNSLAIDVN